MNRCELTASLTRDQEQYRLGVIKRQVLGYKFPKVTHNKLKLP